MNKIFKIINNSNIIIYVEINSKNKYKRIILYALDNKNFLLSIFMNFDLYYIFNNIYEILKFL